jgi:cardiolipin synthase
MLWTAFVLFAVQCAFTGCITAAYRLPARGWLIFFFAALLFHGLILYGMLKLRDLFALAETREPLQRINVSNHLSLFRLSSLPAIVYLIISLQYASVFTVTLVFLAVVFLTDLLDGQLARRLNQVTLIGQYLDSTSDYLVLFATSIIFLKYELITLVFFLLLITRLFVVAGGNTFIYIISGDKEPKTSYLGKASVFAVMGYYGFRLLQFILVMMNVQSQNLSSFYRIVDRLGLMTEGVLVVSIFEKSGMFLKALKTARRNAKS